MGEPLNRSADLIPGKNMYEACRVMARHVRWLGGTEWDFKEVLSAPLDPEFERLIGSYLKTVLEEKGDKKGWKIPETTLVLPWIIRMFPDAKYIFWVRDPRDCILGPHLTDDLKSFGVPYQETEDVRLRRAISWKYQDDLVLKTPTPEKWIKVRFEDFVLHQEDTVQRLEKFLGMRLARIIVQPETVGRWKKDQGVHDFDFLSDSMKRHGYGGEEA
jgi:hypothetical protein